MITTIRTFAFLSYKSGHRENKNWRGGNLWEWRAAGRREGNLLGTHRDASAHIHIKCILKLCGEVEQQSWGWQAGRQAGRSSWQFKTSASPAWAGCANAGACREPCSEHTKAQKCLSSLINIAQRFLLISLMSVHVCRYKQGMNIKPFQKKKKDGRQQHHRPPP